VYTLPQPTITSDSIYNESLGYRYVLVLLSIVGSINNASS